MSGLPVSRPNHAINCVKMGLEMIQAIRLVNSEKLSVCLYVSTGLVRLMGGVFFSVSVFICVNWVGVVGP